MQELRPFSVDVCVPIYRERDALPALFEAIDGLDDAPWRVGRTVEYFLVDDGSDDDSAGLAEALVAKRALSCVHVLRHSKNLGLSAALRTGFSAGRGEVVCWLDADLSYPASVLGGLVELVASGADVATVSPWHPRGEVVGVPRRRVLLSRGLSRACRLATRNGEIHTWSAMVRAWRRPWLARCLPEREGHLGVTESLLRAHALGARIDELPATLHARVAGRSSLRVLPGIAGQIAVLGAAATGRLARASRLAAHG